MKSKYRYFVSTVSNRAIQFRFEPGFGNVGYWRHDRPFEIKPSHRSSLELDFFEKSNLHKEVKRKEFLKFVRQKRTIPNS